MSELTSDTEELFALSFAQQNWKGKHTEEQIRNILNHFDEFLNACSKSIDNSYYRNQRRGQGTNGK